MILDLIGSIVIAGFVMLMGLRMNANIADSNQSYKTDVIVQESLVSLVQSIEYDFRKMGYKVLDPTTVVLRADSTHITFQGDIDDNGVIDTVEWYLGPSITSTPNPKDRILYRKISPPPLSGTAITGSVPGVTQLNIKYLNQEGVPAITLGQIWIVETTLRVESAWTVMDRQILDQKHSDWGYSAAFWKQTRLASRNLRRHG